MGRPAVDVKRTVKLTVTDYWSDEWPEYGDPGQARVFDARENGCVLQHTCPGCGRFGGITVGFGHKPLSPSWQLQTGDPKDPSTWTLAPSIHCKGCCGWHGYLTAGVFTSC